MFEHKGKIVSAKVWMEPQEFYTDGELVKQMDEICRHPAVFHHAALMPDGHKGYGLPIGGVVAFNGHVCPFGVGMDIGCGLRAVRFNVKADLVASRDLRIELKEAIKDAVPMGFSRHPDTSHVKVLQFLDTVRNSVPGAIGDIASHGEILCQLGTLGGGNHFIELQADENGFLWMMIHSGSRNLGARVCKHYHEIAVDYCNKWGISVPCKELSVLPIQTVGETPYWVAMDYCLHFAKDNRLAMSSMVWMVLRRFLPNLSAEEVVDVHHNYASMEEHFGTSVAVHRKGATLARRGSMGVIPGSMGTASYIVGGKGSGDSFASCSHGSGRRMSRNSAKKAINMDDFQAAMGDVVFDFDESLLDESPGAYKDVVKVMDNQSDLVDIIHTLKPLVATKSVKCKEE